MYIGQSSVTNGDDCVPISGDSSNITVEDLTCQKGNGLVPIIWAHHHFQNGTQTSAGGSLIDDIVFRRIKLLSTGEAISVKSESQFAGAVRNVIWEDIEVSATHGNAIMINMFGQNDGAGELRSGMMQLSNITIRNVRVSGAKLAGKIECGKGSNACALSFCSQPGRRIPFQ